MWLCLNNAFLSIVQVPESPNTIRVRARKRLHLEAFLGPIWSGAIKHTPHRDYHWRALLSRRIVARLMQEYALNSMIYDSFKGSVSDPALSKMYNRWWLDHYRYQEEQERQERQEETEHL
jgi:hypothetical protein